MTGEMHPAERAVFVDCKKLALLLLAEKRRMGRMTEADENTPDGPRCGSNDLRVCVLQGRSRFKRVIGASHIQPSVCVRNLPKRSAS